MLSRVGVITRLPLVFTLAVVCASPALASQIQVGYTGSNYGPYQTGQAASSRSTMSSQVPPPMIGSI